MALEMVKILEMRDENPNVRTFVLDKRIEAKPGQFCMLWIPDVNEKPFGFARLNGNIEIMVKKRGKFTKRMFSLREGDMIGFRGPYGNGYFKLRGKNVCLIGGGIGIAPLLPLIDIAIDKNISITIIHGANTRNELIPLRRLKKVDRDNIRIILTTDDGTYGKKGTVCDVLKEIVNEGIDHIYTCGPEIMMEKVMRIALNNNISCQISMERYIKCGIGICGHCAIDNSGLMVCKDGPVFDARVLKDSEFGNYIRDKCGSIINL